MFLRAFVICSILSSGLLSASLALSASFDCTKAVTPLENGICDTPEINRLDGEMGRLYEQLLNELAPQPKKQFVREQRNWLETRNNRCDPSLVGMPEGFRHCMDHLYESRINQLNAELGQPHRPSYPSPDHDTAVCGSCQTAGPDAAMGCAGYTTRSACVGTEQCQWTVGRCP